MQSSSSSYSRSSRSPSFSSNRGGGYGRPQQSRQGGYAQKRGGVVKQFIHPSKFIQQAQPVVEQAAYVSAHQFEDFEIHAKIKANVTAKGYKTPTPIQDQTIPLALSGKDIVGIANTGTGKTAAFAIPMLNKLMNDPSARALVLAPTRELAQQINDECMSFARLSGLRGAVLIGGSSMYTQKRDLRNNPHFVIGTPGRLKDHVKQGTLKLAAFNIVVLDEVDRMLDMGFINDIQSILSCVKKDRQSLFFSATMEPKIKTLINTFSKDPVTVSVKVGAAASSVNQNVVYYRGGSEKIEKLHDILIQNAGSKVIIFDDTKRAVDSLGRELSERGFKVDEIHGDKSQSQRSRALMRFKTNQINVLVATDVAARGIDVSDISHVINYSAPNTYDDYIHRIGRTGRAGKQGNALTFLAS